MTDGNDNAWDADGIGHGDFSEPTQFSPQILCLECLHDRHGRCELGGCECGEGEEE